MHLVAEHGGSITRGSVRAPVDRTYLTTRSIEFDAVVVAAGATSIATEIKAVILLQEAYRHLKVIAAWGDGTDVLTAAGVDIDAPGVVTARSSTASLAKSLAANIGLHRAWDRAPYIEHGVTKWHAANCERTVMHALVLNCTLKPSPSPSNSQALADEVIEALRDLDVEVSRSASPTSKYLRELIPTWVTAMTGHRSTPRSWLARS